MCFSCVFQRRKAHPSQDSQPCWAEETSAAKWCTVSRNCNLSGPAGINCAELTSSSLHSLFSFFFPPNLCFRIFIGINICEGRALFSSWLILQAEPGSWRRFQPVVSAVKMDSQPVRWVPSKSWWVIRDELTVLSSSVFSCTIMMLLLSHSSFCPRAKLLVWTRDFHRVLRVHRFHHATLLNSYSVGLH